MKSISIRVLALAVSVAAGGAFAYQQDNYANDPGYYDSHDYNSGQFVSNHPHSDQAQVIRVERVNDRYSNSGYQRQECWDERTNDYQGGYYRDSDGRLYRSGKDSNADGTIIGAIIGGALGNTVGKGDGRTAATIGGAVIGGAIGNNIDRNNDSYDQYRDNSGTIRRCRMVNDNGNDNGNDYGNDYGNNSRYGGGFNVTYRYAGQVYHAYTRHDPGRYIRVLVDVRPLDQAQAYGQR